MLLDINKLAFTKDQFISLFLLSDEQKLTLKEKSNDDNAYPFLNDNLQLRQLQSLTVSPGASNIRKAFHMRLTSSQTPDKKLVALTFVLNDISAEPETLCREFPIHWHDRQVLSEIYNVIETKILY